MLVLLAAGALLLISSCGATSGQSSTWDVSRPHRYVHSYTFADDKRGWLVTDHSPVSSARVYVSDDGGHGWRLSTGAIVGAPSTDCDALPASIDRLSLPVQVLCIGERVLLTYQDQPPGTASPGAQPNSGVLASVDGGKTWRCLLSLSPDTVLWLMAADTAHLWALCAMGDGNDPGPAYLLASDDAGRSWSRLPEGAYGPPGSSGLTLPPLVFVDALHGWSNFRQGQNDFRVEQSFSTTANGGRAWSSVSWPFETPEFAVSFCALDESRAWTAGRGFSSTKSALCSTADGGRSWQTSNVGDVSLRGVFFADTSHGWVAGFDGKRNIILATIDGGRHWTEEFVLDKGDGDQAAEVVFCRAGRTLFASNGWVILSRRLPSTMQ